MKVLIVGSKSIHVSSFVESLVVEESEVYLISEENCSFRGVVEEKNVSFRSLNPFSILKNYHDLKRYILKLNPDIIHIHQLNRLAYFSSRIAEKLAIPVVSTAWGSDVLIIPFKNRFFRFLTKKSIDRTFVVTADAQVMIDKMLLLNPDKSKYVSLQYGIELITSSTKENIVFSNRLHRSLYRIDSVIRYFFDFLKTHPNWKLIIGGTGDETEVLKQQVISLGIENNVEFVGWLLPDDNKKWYAKSKIYISIPTSDGTSVSVLEAMSAGCIPVLSDIPVTHEWIQNKVNGVIETINENPLISALSVDATISFPMNLELIEKNASRTSCTNRFIEIYQKAIKS